ncbi:dihydrofolate reductase family protein [Salinigranum halophilum]|uniref:dihydrofolate reductase family protein n=1 Tax=Salinigranum halophilum TaxID=2565931 RepID=UPI00115C8664|nr:dihydrofolate reductase family protein [Salinigranum halophilum]
MSEDKITLYIAASVDGYIADEEGGVDWLEEFQTESDGDEDVEGFSEFFETVDCLVMGSATYEQVIDFGEWPYGNKPTYVFTHRSLSPATEAVQFVDDEIADFVPEIRQQYNHIWLVGGAQLAQSFLQRREIDVIRLSFIPILLGEGIPLFSGEYDGQRLSLVDTTTHGSGIVEHHYEVS